MGLKSSRCGGSSLRVVETPVPIEELEEIREKNKVRVELVLIKKIERNDLFDKD